MPIKPKSKTSSSAIQDFTEWQRYQFFPGYYTGGKFHPVLKSQIFRVAVLLFLELLLISIFLFFAENTFWWTLLAVARSSGCSVVDTGLFKPASVQCSNSLVYGSFLETFMPAYMLVISIPVFILEAMFVLGIPVVLPVLFLISWGVSMFLIKKLKLPEISLRFPILLQKVPRPLILCVVLLFSILYLYSFLALR